MALYTQEHLAETLKTLMYEKPLDKITVQELVARAKVNRKTFYFHFHSIADLIKWHYGTVLDEFISNYPLEPDTWVTAFSELTGMIRKDADRLNAIFSSSYSAEFRIYVIRYFDRMVVKFVYSAAQTYEAMTGIKLTLTNQQLKYINRYYSMAFFGMTEQWFMNGMVDSSNEFVHIMKQLSNDNMYRTFAVMHEENISTDRA